MILYYLILLMSGAPASSSNVLSCSVLSVAGPPQCSCSGDYTRAENTTFNGAPVFASVYFNGLRYQTEYMAIGIIFTIFFYLDSSHYDVQR